MTEAAKNPGTASEASPDAARAAAAGSHRPSAHPAPPRPPEPSRFVTPGWWNGTAVVAGAGRLLRAYSDWLASISWGRFVLLAALFMIAVSLLADLPLFQVAERAAERVRYEVHVDDTGAVSIKPASGDVGRQSTETRKARKEQDAAHRELEAARSEAEKGGASAKNGDANVRISGDGIVIDARDGAEKKRITIDRAGVRIESPEGTKEIAASSAAPELSASSPAAPDPPPSPALPALPAAPPIPPVPGTSELPQAAAALGADSQRAAQIKDALDEVISDLEDLANERSSASRKGAFAEFMQTFGRFFVIFSIIMKIEAGRRVKVEVVAAEATELAEAEQLKRQLIEARMQTMQAQVEPHFLFNTLASIDHLIETDPPRASAMQKNLIQYLRAALPKMRESATTLGREVDLIRAYLEILKVRMDDRLQTEFAVPDGLRSAAFPPMMLQSVVENAIKHGLEPKAEGGSIRVAAEIIDGRLRVMVTDTGLGFDPENGRTRGTGLGLTNIRERLALLHEGRGTLSIVANRPSGTVVAIEVPYAISKV